MAVDGTWNVTVNTPMGARPGTLVLTSAGSALSGSYGGPQGSVPFADGKVDGNNVEWTVTVPGPMGQMALGFKGAVDGDSMSGTVQLGTFGQGTFSGTRG